MKLTKVQAQGNRTRIVEAASQLFRERGYDGVGVAELMSAAGFTHGGFYNHFRSKTDLMAHCAADGLLKATARSQAADAIPFIEQYVSRQHRDARGDGCTVAALCGDAARQPDEVKAIFEAGIEEFLGSLATQLSRADRDDGAARVKAVSVFAQAVGAVMLSRACRDDSALADEILEGCRDSILATLSKS